MNKQVYGSGAIAPLQALQRRVTVRVGLFFDGTGNNRVNTRIGAACRAGMARGKVEHSRACAGRHARPDSSYSNELSNIAWLFELYRDQKTACQHNGGWQVSVPLYISGVGTHSGGRDSLWPGLSFGRGHTGVLAKVERALVKLEAALKAFALDNPDCVIEALELDVFGFSRGAASARHLVNEVLKQAKGDLQTLLANRELSWSTDFAWERGSVRVKVVGLFDTVAAIGGWRDLGNVRDANNRRVNLYLPPDCAEHVLHLVARDESRRNFALNSVAPVWPREIVLPGAHSDIGGGYPAHMLEEVLITRPRTSVIGRDVAFEDCTAWQQATDELHAMDRDEWIDPLDCGAWLGVEGSQVSRSGCGTGFGSRLVMAAVCLRRPVWGDLARVHLRIMHALACDEGVPLEPLENIEALALVPPLQDIAQRLLGQARGDTQGLTPGQERLLRWHYIHHSAHWSPIIGTLGSLGKGLFVHAPQPGGRTVHPNVALPGYPH
ncbi:T6SS phospholipase effector Tle1-like catalytic domain-containing protein [Pseudomonas ovata]|uniref:T6SS phospholipase effector Tle1-like catalytic domain-containing protein n=1 Tax=Pseudomonas ovata TaxID=1839709 RepID=UPI000D68BE68|nr:DUF2235 domain-containing protein [Pseudomonas ovata]